MGFGTLFIGYFFLINISYYAYTDIIAGMVMLLGLYKLSSVNESFRRGALCTIAFSVLGLGELVLASISMFGSFSWIDASMPYVSAVRFTLIFVLSYFTLYGISDVSKEVDATALHRTAKASIPLTLVFLVYAMFELPFVGAFFGKIAHYIFFVLLLSVVMFIISFLITIYKAYMQICMPDDLKKTAKNSKFKFINSMYETIERKSEQYAEYKLNKRKNKQRKK